MYEHAYLEHLDEGYAKIDVRNVAANQAQAEKDANGDNGPQVDAAGHGHVFPRVEDPGEPGEALGHDGREEEMPCREEGGCFALDCESGTCFGGVWSGRTEFWERWSALTRARSVAGDEYSLNCFLSSTHLLKRITLELRPIQTLRGEQSALDRDAARCPLAGRTLCILPPVSRASAAPTFR